MSKMVKVTISGSYRNSKREIIDFEKVVGYMPKVDEDLVKLHVWRYARTWIKATEDAEGKKVYEERIDEMRQIFVDTVEDAEGKASFIGKDIKEMSYTELQDLATAKDLRKIPFLQDASGVDLREARTIAYAAYAETLGTEIKYMEVGFSFSALPPLVVDGKARRDVAGKISNEEMIGMEQKPMAVNSSPKSTLSLDDLKGIARQKNIAFTDGIGFDALYAKLYGAGA